MTKLGVDVGGTFTDLVLVDDESGEIKLAKVPSTPQMPDQGVLNGISKIAGHIIKVPMIDMKTLGAGGKHCLD